MKSDSIEKAWGEGSCSELLHQCFSLIISRTWWIIANNYSKWSSNSHCLRNHHMGGFQWNWTMSNDDLGKECRSTVIPWYQFCTAAPRSFILYIGAREERSIMEILCITGKVERRPHDSIQERTWQLQIWCLFFIRLLPDDGDAPSCDHRLEHSWERMGDGASQCCCGNSEPPPLWWNSSLIQSAKILGISHTFSLSQLQSRCLLKLWCLTCPLTSFWCFQWILKNNRFSLLKLSIVIWRDSSLYSA